MRRRGVVVCVCVWRVGGWVGGVGCFSLPSLRDGDQDLLHWVYLSPKQATNKVSTGAALCSPVLQ